MTFEEKLEVAGFLDEMGVDIFEAGFPIASEGDFAVVSEIARRVKRAVDLRPVARRRDRYRPGRRGGEGRPAPAHPHLPLHPPGALKHKLQQVGRAVLEPWCSSRSPRPQLGGRRGVVGRGRDPHRVRLSLPCVEIAIKAGATTINVPDTVGYATPEEYGEMFRR